MQEPWQELTLNFWTLNIFIIRGGGFLYGDVSRRRGAFTGEDFLFIYPDLRTAFIGWFDDGVMISAREGVVKA